MGVARPGIGATEPRRREEAMHAGEWPGVTDSKDTRRRGGGVPDCRRDCVHLPDSFCSAGARRERRCSTSSRCVAGLAALFDEDLDGAGDVLGVRRLAGLCRRAGDRVRAEREQRVAAARHRKRCAPGL